MLYQLVNICGTLIENFSFILFFSTFFERKYTRQWLYILPVFVHTFFIVSANDVVGLENSISVVCITLYCITGTLLFHKRIYLKFILSIVYYILLVLLDYFIIAIFSLVKAENASVLIGETRIYMIMVIISKVTLFLLILLFYKNFRNEILQLHFKRKNWLVIFLIQIFSFFVIIFYLWNEIVFEQATHSIFLILCCVLGIMILEFYMLKKISQQNEVEMKNKLLQTELKMKSEYISSVQDHLQKTNQLYHDFNKHLCYISLLIEQRDFDKADEYLKSVTHNYAEPRFAVYTEHQIIDIILNHKMALAAADQIQFELKIKDLQKIQIDDMDLVILLDNALDNAIEASRGILNAVIRVKLVHENHQLFISIINPCTREVKIHHQNIESSKPDAEKHGIGLVNMKQVIHKYHGDLMLRYQDGYFYFICQIKDE